MSYLKATTTLLIILLNSSCFGMILTLYALFLHVLVVAIVVLHRNSLNSSRIKELSSS